MGHFLDSCIINPFVNKASTFIHKDTRNLQVKIVDGYHKQIELICRSFGLVLTHGTSTLRESSWHKQTPQQAPSISKLAIQANYVFEFSGTWKIASHETDVHFVWKTSRKSPCSFRIWMLGKTILPPLFNLYTHESKRSDAKKFVIVLFCTVNLRFWGSAVQSRILCQINLSSLC